jgi:hypothetical protein
LVAARRLAPDWFSYVLAEAFPLEASHKHLIFNRDPKFGFEVIAAVKAIRIIPKRLPSVGRILNVRHSDLENYTGNSVR